MGQVQISTAFESPDVLQNCLSFLRQYATDMGAHAACAVVPKKAIAYPQVSLYFLIQSFLLYTKTVSEQSSPCVKGFQLHYIKSSCQQ